MGYLIYLNVLISTNYIEFYGVSIFGQSPEEGRYPDLAKCWGAGGAGTFCKQDNQDHPLP